MDVLMVGVDESTKGGMWTVVENYLKDETFVKANHLIYIPTSVTGCSLPKKLIFTARAYGKIWRAFFSKKFDITHVHMSERASIKRKGYVMRYAKRRGSKVVLHMHGAEFEVLYKQMSPKKQNEVREILDLADRVIILGNYWKDFVGSLLKYPDRIRVIYNAVKVPDTYCYDKSSNRVLFLGAVSERKGISVLLNALQKSAKFISNQCIVDIYGTDVEGNIEQEIENRNLHAWVRYRGWLNKEEKGNILAHTAVNVLPSYHEGLPMTLLEAMSYGVPSITTNVAAIPEAVNVENGIVIHPGDVDKLGEALVELIHNQDKRVKLSLKAYQDAVEKFSVEKHISAVQDIYKELME